MSSSTVAPISASGSDPASSDSPYAAARAATAAQAAAASIYTLPRDETDTPSTIYMATSSTLEISPQPSTVVKLSTKASALFSDVKLQLIDPMYGVDITQQSQLVGSQYAAQLANPDTLNSPNVQFVADYTSAPLTPIMSAGEFVLGDYASWQLGRETNQSDLYYSYFTFDSYSQSVSDSSASVANAPGKSTGKTSGNSTTDSTATATDSTQTSPAASTETRTVDIQGSGHILLADGEYVAFTAELSVSGSLSAFPQDDSTSDAAPASASASTAGAASSGSASAPTASGTVTSGTATNSTTTSGAKPSGTAATGIAAPPSPRPTLSQSELTDALEHASEILLMIDSIKIDTSMPSYIAAKTNDLSQVMALSESAVSLSETFAPPAKGTATQKNGKSQSTSAPQASTASSASSASSAPSKSSTSATPSTASAST